MKKFVNVFLAVCLTLSIVSCTVDDTTPSALPKTPVPTQTQDAPVDIQPSETDLDDSDATETPELPFEGKIAIITNALGSNVNWDTALPVVSKYGEDKVLLVECRVNS